MAAPARSLVGISLSLVPAARASQTHAPEVVPQPSGYDVVISNGRIADGTGNPWFYGDVGVVGDRIARVTRAGLLHDAAAKRRIDATGLVAAADRYPYTGGQNNLSSCIPPWAHADGKLLDRLCDPATRARIKTEMQDPHANFESLCLAATPAGVEVVGFPDDSLKRYEGKRLTEIAQAWAKHWTDALMDLTLLEQNKLGQVIFIASASNVALQVQQPWMKFGTDAEAFDPDSARVSTHPRAYGTYPRILGRTPSSTAPRMNGRTRSRWG